jgi:hypothetical protein
MFSAKCGILDNIAKAQDHGHKMYTAKVVTRFACVQLGLMTLQHTQHSEPTRNAAL